MKDIDLQDLSSHFQSIILSICSANINEIPIRIYIPVHGVMFDNFVGDVWNMLASIGLTCNIKLSLASCTGEEIHHHLCTLEKFQSTFPKRLKIVLPSNILAATHKRQYLGKFVKIAICVDITESSSHGLIN
jgi:hypothetical protein